MIRTGALVAAVVTASLAAHGPARTTTTAGLDPTGAPPAYRTGPPPAHTGAFDEPDCGACHFDAVRDDPAGGVRLGTPDRYRAGRSYTLTVTLRHPELEAGGFQLSVRYADGPRAGAQAGELAATSGRSAVARADGVAYASHTAAGTAAQGGSASWELRWTAPAEAGTVAFDVAAQAANDDDSEFGERLYTARRLARPAGKARGVGRVPPLRR